MTTCYKIYPEEWNVGKETIMFSYSDPKRVMYLMNQSYSLRNEVEQLKESIRYMEDRGDYTLEDIIAFILIQGRISISVISGEM